MYAFSAHTDQYSGTSVSTATCSILSEDLLRLETSEKKSSERKFTYLLHFLGLINLSNSINVKKAKMAVWACNLLLLKQHQFPIELSWN